MNKKESKRIAIEKATELIKLLKENRIHISRAYLFGSAVNDKSKHSEMSDIDLAIISDDFPGFRIDDNKKIIPFVVQVDPMIETHPYTEKDFNESMFAQQEIIAKGIELSTE